MIGQNWSASCAFLCALLVRDNHLIFWRKGGGAEGFQIVCLVGTENKFSVAKTKWYACVATCEMNVQSGKHATGF